MDMLFRAADDHEQAGNESYRYSSSPANQRIEGWWSFLRRNGSSWWIDLFKDMVYYGLLHVGDQLHMECLWFCFSRVLQNDLDKVKDHWNSHMITKSQCSTVHGIPDIMYFLPEYHGYQDCLVSVSQLQVDEMEEHCQIDAEENIYNEYFEYLSETLGLDYPDDVEQALHLYQRIIGLQ